MGPRETRDSESAERKIRERERERENEVFSRDP